MRLSLLCLLPALLFVAACDSEEPSDGATPGALIGAWSLQETVDETFLTVTETQTFINRSGPQTGSVAFTGARTGTLRFITSSPETSSETRLTSFDPTSPDPPQGLQYELRMSLQGYASLYAFEFNGTSTAYEYFGGGAPLFTYSGGRVTVRSFTLQSFSGGNVTVAAGSISFPTIQIQANQSTLVSSVRTPFADDPFSDLDALRYVFEDDGVYRAERDFYPNVTRSFAGTWSTDGDRLRLSIADEDQNATETRTYGYAVTDGQLLLDVSSDECRGNRSCLAQREQFTGLRAGTLSAVMSQSRQVFTPVVAGASRPAPAAAEPPADPRREAQVWPRVLARTVATR